MTERSETLELKGFPVLQMNQWLGKFWNERRCFKIALIGDRESAGRSFLSNILGMKHRRAPVGDSTRHRTIRFDGDGVRVDADLVSALADTAGYKNEGYIEEVRRYMETDRRYDLVIFCVNMSDTRLRNGVFRTFQQLKTDWSRTVIVLTYADALPALMRYQESDFSTTYFPIVHFETKLEEWTTEIKTMLKRVGVQQEVVANMNVYPCANEPEDLLPNGKPWLAPLSLAIMEILSPEKKEEFLKEYATIFSNVAAAAEQPVTLSPTNTVVSEDQVTSCAVETPEVQSTSESNLQASAAPCVLSEDQSRSIRAALSKLRKDCPEFGVLVIGRTGVGKSTLINNLLGKEVTNVGHTLRSETPTVNEHKDTVEGVHIIVYDTPGLGDIKGEEDEKQHLDTVKDLLVRGKIHLVVYCFQMNKTIIISSHIGPLCKYHQIGVDWERSVVALTFADALYVPRSDWGRPMRHFFDERLAFLEKNLKKELVKTVGVKSDVVKKLKMYPTTPLPKYQLPNGNPWYVPLWLHIVEILSPAATVRYLDMHRNNISDELTPPLRDPVSVELKLCEQDRNRFAHSVVATVDATRMVSDEVLYARLTTVLKAGVGVAQELFFHDPACQSGIEPNQERQKTLNLFRTFGVRFANEVRSRDNPAFTSKLQYQNVIPENLKNQIAEARENNSANWLLFDFLCQQATCESLRKLLEAMIEAKGHPAMNKLGLDMKTELGLYIYTSTV